MLAQARAKHPELELRLIQGQSLPFQDASSEAAFGMHVFMHLDLATIKALLTELHRVIGPGGHLEWLRRPLLPADEALSKSGLRRFSSYRLYKLQRLM